MIRIYNTGDVFSFFSLCSSCSPEMETEVRSFALVKREKLYSIKIFRSINLLFE